MTSFRSYFDQRKCEGCTDGVYKSDSNTGDYLNCPDPCPRISNNDYVAEQFNKWLENEGLIFNEELLPSVAFSIANTLEKRIIAEEFVAYVKENYPAELYTEAFYDWLEKNKKIFTANDYFEMGSAV